MCFKNRRVPKTADKTRRSGSFHRLSSVSSECRSGCATCSPLNGCLTCKSRFFFHLELDGIRQRGTCLASCPRGHYGRRSPGISTCTRCKADCASCFSQHFCTSCHPGHFLFRGRCESSCPEGLTENAALRECTDHCEVGEWSRWGSCIRKRRMRRLRGGEQTRTRRILNSSSVHGDPCPHVSEIRKCVIKKRRTGGRGGGRRVRVHLRQQRRRRGEREGRTDSSKKTEPADQNPSQRPTVQLCSESSLSESGWRVYCDRSVTGQTLNSSVQQKKTSLKVPGRKTTPVGDQSCAKYDPSMH
uniref:R-spondin-3-like n=1 Tax=Acanthochromis polyacanthus TaxID=80966 RepID=A0A3Q1EDF4_9TELE